MDEVDWTKAADSAGFKYTWATEHHFLEEYSHLSANESFLGYIAGQTERIHIGTGIMNITPPVNHPARVAERAAMLDHLSGGRFELGIGRGSSSTEQRGFGIDDPELTKEMFDEVVGQLPQMWREGTYAYEGKYFSMPERNVLPKPYTDAAPAAVGRRRQPVDVREGRPDGPRRAVLRPSTQPRGSRPAHRDLQEDHRRTPSRSAATSTTTSWSPARCCASRTATGRGRSPPT